MRPTIFKNDKILHHLPRVVSWLSGQNPTKVYLDAIVKQFTTSSYYFMFPFGSIIRKLFQNKFEKITTGGKSLPKYLQKIKKELDI